MALLHSIRQRLAHIIRPIRRQTPHERPTRQLGYVIPLSDEIQNAVRRLQLRLLDDFGPRLQIEGHPHITLKQGFRVAAIEPFERYLDGLVGNVEPFEVRVRDIGCFEEGIVFLDVIQSNPLSALRRRIVHDLSNDFGVVPNPLEDERYRFHVTVAHGVPSKHFERVQRTARGERLDFRFTCDRLGLLLHTGREWFTYKRLPLARSR